MLFYGIHLWMLIYRCCFVGVHLMLFICYCFCVNAQLLVFFFVDVVLLVLMCWCSFLYVDLLLNYFNLRFNVMDGLMNFQREIMFPRELPLEMDVLCKALK
jgi:hypothetical protein